MAPSRAKYSYTTADAVLQQHWSNTQTLTRPRSSFSCWIIYQNHTFPDIATHPWRGTDSLKDAHNTTDYVSSIDWMHWKKTDTLACIRQQNIVQQNTVIRQPKRRHNPSEKHSGKHRGTDLLTMYGTTVELIYSRCMAPWNWTTHKAWHRLDPRGTDSLMILLSPVRTPAISSIIIKPVL